MAAYFAQASIDENGKIAGGVAGNQNGKELNTCSVYASSSKPWLFSVIPLNEAVRAEMNSQAKAGVANPYIGYDQYQRNTILIQAKKVGWDLSKITVACECDCSSFLATVMICAVYKVLGQAAGDMVYNALYAGGNLPATGNFKSKLASLGAYFTTGSASYTAGYGLIRDGHAVCVVDLLVTAGKLSSGSTAAASSSLASSKYPCKGWSGDEVKRLQKALIEKGYSCGTSGADGSFGPDTDSAVRKFQTDRGLEVDGIVGPMTQTALYGSSTPAASSTTYTMGEYVTIVDGLRVRTGAGTGYSQKPKSQLTADGQKHSDSLGQLYSGTNVTVTKVLKDSGGNTWGLIPSGWICLEWNGKPYAKKR